MVNMGIGNLGVSTYTIGRKMRYILSGEFPSGKVPEHFVKYTHHGEKKEFTTTWVDAGTDESKELYTVFAACYQSLQEPIDPQKLEAQKGTALVSVRNGVGEVLEKHKFGGVLPSSIDFGDLDFTSSDSVTIDITWKYDTWEFETMIPKFGPVPPETPANSPQPS